MNTPDRAGKKGLRFRPAWHRVVGWVVLVTGIAIAVLNDLMLISPGATLLPGGHTEFYLAAGLVLGGSSLWWFGWMERTS